MLEWSVLFVTTGAPEPWQRKPPPYCWARLPMIALLVSCGEPSVEWTPPPLAAELPSMKLLVIAAVEPVQ